MEPFAASAGQFGPFLPLACSLCGHCGAIWAFFAPGGRSLGPLRGNSGRFCPWRAVFGATAGQFGAFLPLGCSRWGHCGAIWAFFAPGVQSLGPLRGNLGRFCPWGRFQKSQRHTAQRTTLPLKRIPRKRIVTIGRGDYSKVSIFMSDTVISNTVPKHK